MKFSKMVDYKGTPHFVCKTGRKNIRILEPGLPYEKSFVVPIKKVANRRPADINDMSDNDFDPTDMAEELEDLAVTPQ